jgi:hypothetical protein
MRLKGLWIAFATGLVILSSAGMSSAQSAITIEVDHSWVLAIVDASVDSGPPDDFYIMDRRTDANPFGAMTQCSVRSVYGNADAWASGRIMISGATVDLDLSASSGSWSLAPGAVATAFSHTEAVFDGYVTAQRMWSPIFIQDPMDPMKPPFIVGWQAETDWLTQRQYEGGVLIHSLTSSFAGPMYAGWEPPPGDQPVLNRILTLHFDASVDNAGSITRRWEYERAVTQAYSEMFIAAPHQTTRYDLGPSQLYLSFGDVAQAGAVTATTLNITGGCMPPGSPAGVAAWELTASEDFQFGEGGSATLTFDFSDVALGSQVTADDIHLMHWNETEWVDVTDTVDMEHKTITSIALDSFSPFVLTPEPGTISLLALGGLAVIRRRRK